MSRLLVKFCIALTSLLFFELGASAQDMCWRDTYGLGAGVVPADCSSDQEKVGLLCYPKCRAGYSGVVTSCHQDCPDGFIDDGLYCRKKNLSADCPSGMTNIGVSCQKNANYQRPTQSPGCGPGQVYDAGLCYPAAKPGYIGVGPVAWMQCPASHPFQCGAGCATDQNACAKGTDAMVVSVVEVALKIAQAALTGGTSMATETASSAVDLTKQLVDTVPPDITQDSLRQMLTDAASEKGQQLDPTAADEVAHVTMQAKQTGGQIDYASLDPSGIAKVVKAFNLPLCNAVDQQTSTQQSQPLQPVAFTVPHNQFVGLAGKCLDVNGGIAADGTPVILFDCHDAPNQRWRVEADGSIQGLAGKCLDVNGNDSTSVILYACHGSANQKWSQNSDGTIRGVDGKCLDVRGGNSANATPIVAWPCTGGANQRWMIK